jgi:hypothetical protein
MDFWLDYTDIRGMFQLKNGVGLNFPTVSSRGILFRSWPYSKEAVVDAPDLKPSSLKREA